MQVELLFFKITKTRDLIHMHNFSQQYGDTPLHIAVRYGHTEVCKMLMETKINISEQNNVS